MAIVKDNKRGTYYISYKIMENGRWKTRNIRKSEWKAAGDLKVTQRYMRSIESAEIDEDKRRHSCQGAQGTTVKDACESFLSAMKVAGMRPGTIYKYEHDLKNYLIPALGESSLAESAFTASGMDEARLLMSKADMRAESMNSKISTIKKLVSYMRSRHILSRDRADECADVLTPVRKDGADERKKPNFFVNGDDDVAKFFETFSKEDAGWLTPIQVLFYGAFRIGEFLGITADCVNPQNDSILVCKQVLGNGEVENSTKTGRDRLVRLPHPVMERLMAYISENSVNPDGFVFSVSPGKPVSRMTVRRIVNRHLSMAGMEHITLHGLRHSMATRMFDRGYDVREVQEQLGHSSMDTTMDFYIHYTESKRKKDLDDLL